MSQAAKPSPTTPVFPHDPLVFPIGYQKTAPLVTVADLQAHLRLLAAFNKLKHDVQQAEGVTDPMHAWVAFLNKASYRFDKFMSGKWTEDFPSWSEAAIPPLDVVMVWHTYLLNPRTYLDDSMRRTTPFARRLAAMESMPYKLLASLIDPATLEPTAPSSERKSFFEKTSGLPFAYSITTSPNDIVSLSCPCCNGINTAIPWITSAEPKEGEGKGFGEVNFVHNCEHCSRKFTRSMMGVRKFADEVTRRRGGSKTYFSETLLVPMTGKDGKVLADLLAVRMIRALNTDFHLDKPCPQDKIIDEATRLASGLKWSTQELTIQLHKGLRPRQEFHVDDPLLPRVQRIVAAYSHAGLASIDLVAAVLRQASFIEKMEGLGWLDKGRFDAKEDQSPLLRAMARYHAYLDLMFVKEGSFLVPTLDIDLVWHTHQLSGAQYRADSQRFLKRVPNHDDSVQPLTIQSGYNNTAAAWKARFGVPYSVCGCMPDDAPAPPPTALSPTKSKPTSDDASVSKSEKKKKGSMFKLFSSGHKKTPSASSSSSSSVPVAATSLAYVGIANGAPPRAELVPEKVEECDTSHPSEHVMRLEKSPRKIAPSGEKEKAPVVSVEGDLTKREELARERVQAIKHAEKAGEGADGKEEVDKWRVLQVERKEIRKDHTEAFVSPDPLSGDYYPYWGVNSAMPFGFYGSVKYADAVGGCASGCASESAGGGGGIY